MWFAVVGGIGLALGVGLLIWGLRERSARHGAELEAEKMKRDVADARREASENAAAARLASEDADRASHAAEELRVELQKMRDVIVTRGDPAAVHALLDDSTQEEDL